MGLSVLPGANTLVDPIFVVAARLVMLFGLYVGHCAIARIAPVFGAMTMIEQFRACVWSTR